MNPIVTLDFLIHGKNGDTFHFDSHTCPSSLLKEAILQGLQVMHYEDIFTDLPFLDYVYFAVPGEGWGSGHSTGQGAGPVGEGYGQGYGKYSLLNDFIPNFGFGISSGTYLNSSLIDDLLRSRSCLGSRRFKNEFGFDFVNGNFFISDSESEENSIYFLS